MHFDRLVALLPCQSLEDFDLDRREEDAEQLLAAWSALWHPALLADARVLPKWLPAYGSPPESSGHLVVVPDCCETSMADDWFTQAETAGACVVRHFRHRDEIVAAALERLASDHLAVDPDVAADFLALGYCHLQVELLTRKLRYMSNLDEAGLCNAALAAADCAVAGDSTEARRHLQSAFDRLHEAREYFYPSEPRLLDLTLVASTTLGQALRDELAVATPCNMLLSGDVLEEMAQSEPETLDALRRALDAGTAAIIGGERTESPLPMLEPEAIADGPIIEPFFQDPDLERLFELSGTICLVDSINFQEEIGNFEQQKQIMLSDLIIMNKISDADEVKLTYIRKKLAALNSTAQIIETDFAFLDPSHLYILQPQMQDEFIKKLRKPIYCEPDSSDFHSFTIRFGGYINEKKFREWFKYFASIYRKQIFRIKGMINFENSPLTGIVQSVGGMTNISEGSVANPYEPLENVLVFIGKGISKFEIEKIFQQYLLQEN